MSTIPGPYSLVGDEDSDSYALSRISYNHRNPGGHVHPIPNVQPRVGVQLTAAEKTLLRDEICSSTPTMTPVEGLNIDNYLTQNVPIIVAPPPPPKQFSDYLIFTFAFLIIISILSYLIYKTRLSRCKSLYGGTYAKGIKGDALVNALKEYLKQ